LEQDEIAYLETDAAQDVMKQSLLLNDERWLQFMHEKIQTKSQKYERLKKYGIVVIAILVIANDFLATEIDYIISNPQDLSYLGTMILGNFAVIILLLLMFCIALFLLVSATRTMDKIDAARGESQQKLGIKTI
jgi:hypothetical protein